MSIIPVPTTLYEARCDHCGFACGFGEYKQILVDRFWIDEDLLGGWLSDYWIVDRDPQGDVVLVCERCVDRSLICFYPQDGDDCGCVSCDIALKESL